MGVYVDDMYRIPLGRYGRMRMSHMIASTTEELLAMADHIGLNRKWLQNEGEPSEHFDLSLAKRVVAVEAGAVGVAMRELSWMVRERNPRRRGGLSPPPRRATAARVRLPI